MKTLICFAVIFIVTGCKMDFLGGGDWLNPKPRTPIPGADINSLAVSGTTIFAWINGGGLFISNNNAAGWAAANNGLSYYLGP